MGDPIAFGFAGCHWDRFEFGQEPGGGAFYLGGGGGGVAFGGRAGDGDDQESDVVQDLGGLVG